MHDTFVFYETQWSFSVTKKADPLFFVICNFLTCLKFLTRSSTFQILVRSEFEVLSEFVVFHLWLSDFLKERFLEILVFEGVFELHVLVQKNKKLSCRAYHISLFLTCLFALVDLDLFHTLIVITCWERCF